ncbi:hypothetical protein Ancab_020729 [Ancistrocladus abbreviatus]
MTIVLGVKPLVIEAKAGKRARTRTENPKIRNRRLQKKFDGTSTKPRLSVFCSDRQLYAMLVDDQIKKCLFFGSTLQKSIRTDPVLSTVLCTFSSIQQYGGCRTSWCRTQKGSHQS